MENLDEICESEKKLLSSKEQQDGYRLACQAHIQGDVVVFVPEESRMGKQVIRKTLKEVSAELKPAVRKYYVEIFPAHINDSLGDGDRLNLELKQKFNLPDLKIDHPVLIDLQKVLRTGEWKVTVSVWMNQEIIKVEPGYVKKAYGLALDVGTTTLAGYLYDLHDGKLVTTAATMNPQVIYGEDVMSRIAYHMSNKDGLELMNKVIIDGINEIVNDVAAQSNIEGQDIVDMVFVGNTCMHHLFLNIDPLYIGKSPFSPAINHSLDIKARDLGIGISSGGYIHILPIEAGFVGADNVGVLISEEPYNQDDMVLIIDIGTNGELIMGNRKMLLSASCATGPAFEGAGIKYGMRAATGAIDKIEIDKDTKETRYKVIGKNDWNTNSENFGAKGICGSGIIDAVAQILLAGVIDYTGRFKKDIKTPRLQITEDGPEFVIAWANETSIGKNITICHKDVRNVQLAKAAMYAGAKIMMHHLNINKLDKVILAGAFGSYIDKTSAAIIGLFPDCSFDNIYAVGNAAGDGASMALINTDKRIEANLMARKLNHIELTTEPNFVHIFGKAMWFPSGGDEFPMLSSLLPI